MGADMHIIIEAKTGDTWRCLWNSRITQSDWYYQTYLAPKKLRSYDDPMGLGDVRERDYDLFGLLSSVRGFNNLALQDIGTRDGIATPGWPQNLSLAGQWAKDDPNYHSRGHMTLAEIRTLSARMAAPNTGFREEAETLTRWHALVEDVLEKLIDQKLFGRFFGAVDEEKNSDFSELESAHATLANKSGDLWRDSYDADDIRLLLMYDS